MREFFLSSDLARLAGISAGGVREAIVRGDAVPIGRTPGGVSVFDAASVERWLEARRTRRTPQPQAA